MSSPQAIDSQKAAAQLARFFKDARQERQRGAAKEALRRRDEALKPFDGARSMLDFDAQRGRGMSREEFCRRLRKLNRNLEFEPSLWDPTVWGIYLRDGISNLESPISRYKGVKFICGLPSTFLTEGTLLKKKPKLLKNGEIQEESAGKIPGWRDILKSLMKSGLITYTAADREFSFSSRESARWHQVMH